MRAGQDVDLALGRLRENLFDLLGRPESAQHLDPDGERGKAALETLVVLKREHRSGRQYRHLLAVAERLKRRAHRDLGFSETDVATKQPVHGLLALHIAL